MKKVLTTVFISSMLFVMNASAGEGWTGQQTIAWLEAGPTGTEIRLVDRIGNACTAINEVGAKTWGLIPTNNKELLSLALVAFTAGKKIDMSCGAADWSAVTKIIIKP